MYQRKTKFGIHLYFYSVIDTISSMSREDICSTLANSDAIALETLINSLIANGKIFNIEMIRPAVTGTIQMQVREPICEERFIVGDALVTIAEVSVDGTLGWAMRLGGDANAAVAAAVADAHIARVGFEGVPELAELVLFTKSEIERADEQEWAEIRETIIDFEELD